MKYFTSLYRNTCKPLHIILCTSFFILFPFCFFAFPASPDFNNIGYESPLNPFDQYGDNWYECTRYAFGRTYEKTGNVLAFTVSRDRHGGRWYDIVKDLPRGATPKSNSIAVWDYGLYGHVAYVETVSNDNVTFSEANFSSPTNGLFNGFKTLTSGQMTKRGSYVLRGYIYLGSNDTPSDTSKPDLVISTLSINALGGPSTQTLYLGPAELFHIDVYVKNQGSANVGKEFKIKYMRSGNKDFDSNDIALTNADTDTDQSLQAGETKRDDTTANAPSAVGRYYIGAWADSGTDIDEERNTNNFSDADDEIGTIYVVGDGFLGNLADGRVFLFEGGKWRYLPDWAYLDCRGGQRNVFPITQAVFDKYGEGAVIPPCYIAPTNTPPEGKFEQASCNGLVGWARDPDTPLPITVHVYDNGPAGAGTFVTSATADILRADLAIDDKSHGFNITIPESLRDSQPHTLYVYAIDSSGGGPNPLIEGSPQPYITCDPYFALTISKDGNGTGIVSSTPPGISCGTDCIEGYLKGTVVSLTATPAANTIFTGWGGTAIGTVNPIALTIESPQSVTANFALKQFTVTGRVTRDGAGIEGVKVNGLPGNPITNDAGEFSTIVNFGWSGQITLSKYGYHFTPSSLDISAVSSNRANSNFVGAMVETEFSREASSSETFSVVESELNAGAAARSGSAYAVQDRIGDGFGGVASALQVTALIVATPNFIDFGSIATGKNSISSLMVKNEGSGAVFIDSFSVAGTNSGDFALQNDTCSGHTLVPGGLCTAKVTFAPASVGTKSAVVAVSLSGLVSPVLTIPVTGAGKASALLTTTILGSGGGSVHSNPEGVACTSGTCQGVFDSGTSVILIETPNSVSTFAGWGGACTATNANCNVAMTADKSVTATFNAASKARIGSTGYSSLAAAYAAATNNAWVLLLGTDLLESLIVNRGITITLRGGYYADFSGRSGLPTELKGKLIIRTGRVTADRLTVK